MPYKTCPRCKGISYSAADIGCWECPYCGRDLTRLKSSTSVQKKAAVIELPRDREKYQGC